MLRRDNTLRVTQTCCRGNNKEQLLRSLELPCFGDQGADATDGYSVALQRWA